MRSFRKTAVVSVVWLAAGMTVFAGMPRFVCRCPNGQLKLFCFNPGAPGRTCCCGGKCCGSNEVKCCCAGGQSETGSPCCGQRSQQQDSMVTSSCCTKTAVRSELFLTPKTTVVEDLPLGSFLDTNITLVPHSPVAGHRQFSWQPHRAPPPTDLVITLQHILI